MDGTNGGGWACCGGVPGFHIGGGRAGGGGGFVHGLDAGTSGLMVVAKSERAYTELKRQFHDREVTKIYHTVVQGHPDPLRGTIDAPVGSGGLRSQPTADTRSRTTRRWRHLSGHPCWKFILRQDEPTRFGCTWRHSAIPVSVTSCTVLIRCSQSV